MAKRQKAFKRGATCQHCQVPRRRNCSVWDANSSAHQQDARCNGSRKRRRSELGDSSRRTLLMRSQPRNRHLEATGSGRPNASYGRHHAYCCELHLAQERMRQIQAKAKPTPCGSLPNEADTQREVTVNSCTTSKAGESEKEICDGRCQKSDGSAVGGSCRAQTSTSRCAIQALTGGGVAEGDDQTEKEIRKLIMKVTGNFLRK